MVSRSTPGNSAWTIRRNDRERRRLLSMSIMDNSAYALVLIEMVRTRVVTSIRCRGPVELVRLTSSEKTPGIEPTEVWNKVFRSRMFDSVKPSGSVSEMRAVVTRSLLSPAPTVWQRTNG